MRNIDDFMRKEFPEGEMMGSPEIKIKNPQPMHPAQNANLNKSGDIQDNQDAIGQQLIQPDNASENNLMNCMLLF